MVSSEQQVPDPLGPLTAREKRADWQADPAGKLRFQVRRYLHGLQAAAELALAQGNFTLWMESGGRLKSLLETYHACYRQIADNNLGPLIADDDVWELICHSSLPAAAQPFYRSPRTLAERLQYATAFTELLLYYRQGRRTGFLPGLVAAASQLSLLRSQDAVLAPEGNIYLYTRFAAFYDYFAAGESAAD